MKLRNTTQLNSELAWRKRELITLRFMIVGGRDHQGEALRRAGLALLYAHWEGFVKAAGTAYVQFVARQNVTHRRLSPNFLALAIKRELHAASASSKASIFAGVARYFTERMDERAKILWDNSIQTKSNLSAALLREIIATLGLDYSPYEVKEKTVVERLRDLRNSIAHGKYLSVDSDEYERLHSDVIKLMDTFRDQIDNAAQVREFERT